MINNDKSGANWQDCYKELIATPEQAVGKIQPGQRVFVATGCGAPTELTKALAAQAERLRDAEIVHLLTHGEAPYATLKLAELFRINCFYVDQSVRGLIQEGLGDYTPINLSDIPELFSSGQLALDAALVQVTPPDHRGLCSLGVSVDIVRSAIENARLVIAQVNPRMPRTMGDSNVNVHDFDMLVPADVPLLEYKAPAPDETTRKIGEYVASLVDDGSTVAFGVNSVAHSLPEFLKGKRDLGVHTVMFTDALIDMIESGVITGKRKGLDRERVVASFCMGTKRLYDYINNNPKFSFQRTEYVNDPVIISRHPHMVAISVGLEVDLTGQVSADSQASKFFSGIGGQIDFNRGASRSVGGRFIIAMPSLTDDGQASRIVCRLSPGAGVATTRAGVHYVVTEYGVAYLRGKSIQERTMALISVAHPKFREQLMQCACEAKYVRPEMAGREGRIYIGPPELRSTCLLTDGTQLILRPVHPTDVPKMKELFYALSKETVYYRLLPRSAPITLKEIRNFVYVDHRSEVAIVATVPGMYEDSIIAVGRYYLDQKTNRAEIAFAVAEAWQRKGVGSVLFNSLTDIAKRNGIGGFTAEVPRDNKAMQSVLDKSETKVASTLSGDVYSYRLDFV